MENRFIKANGNGQSQCYNCGMVSWDSFMYIDNKFSERICYDCRKLVECGNPETKIQWKDFEPRHREENVIKLLRGNKNDKIN